MLHCVHVHLLLDITDYGGLQAEITHFPRGLTPHHHHRKKKGTFVWKEQIDALKNRNTDGETVKVVKAAGMKGEGGSGHRNER